MGRSKAPSLPIKALSFCRPTELRAERWYAVPKGDETAGLGGFLGLTGPMGRRVLKFDGAFGPEGCGGGFAAGCVEGLHRFAQGATAASPLRVADCRSAAMLIKSALRDWLSVSYGMIGILRIGSLRSPPLSGCAGLLHGKACHTILRSLCFLTNRVPLPPLCRGQNKTPRENLLINPPLEMTVTAGSIQSCKKRGSSRFFVG